MGNVATGGGGRRRRRPPPGGGISAPLPATYIKEKITRVPAKAKVTPKPKPKTPSVMRAGKTKSVAMGVARKRK